MDGESWRLKFCEEIYIKIFSVIVLLVFEGQERYKSGLINLLNIENDADSHLM